MTYDATSIIDSTKRHVLEELLRSNVAIDADTPLIEQGHLTSLQTVELVEHLCEKYGIEIEPEEVNEDEFRSLRTIAALVLRKLGT